MPTILYSVLKTLQNKKLKNNNKLLKTEMWTTLLKFKFKAIVFEKQFLIKIVWRNHILICNILKKKNCIK